MYALLLQRGRAFFIYKKIMVYRQVAFLAVALITLSKKFINWSYPASVESLRLVYQSCERLIGALCMEWSDEWITGRRYLDMTDLK